MAFIFSYHDLTMTKSECTSSVMPSNNSTRSNYKEMVCKIVYLKMCNDVYVQKSLLVMELWVNGNLRERYRKE